MRRTELLLEVMIVRFEEIYGIWGRRHIKQEEAALMPAVGDHIFQIAKSIVKPDPLRTSAAVQSV